ncbi:MAG: crosslink repair DNA glycosylase YcaQ family protein [Anaerolineae bacterium]|nr:crosslink repair DNA glycosylase YcaQ family protein [Anaerolineae bacterium]
MAIVQLTLEQARRCALAYQGLLPPYTLNGKTGIMTFIQRVGCIQFDPLNIVGRNPDLVLQSRVSDYTPAVLESLLYKDRSLVDGWDKMMAIYAVEDWPYFHRHRTAQRAQLGKADRPAMTIIPQVREAIREQGPLSSLDLDHNETVNWSWAPTRIARAALESMYAWGELIVHHKINTRKVYDFAANHIAPELLQAPDPFANETAYFDWHILRRLGSIGMIWNRAGNIWLAMHGIKSKQREATFQRLLNQEKILPVEVPDLSETLYIRAADLDFMRHARDLTPPAPRASIIAPLDNLMWDRDYIQALFDFRYRWEVYMPAAKREYGYYVLPLLYGDRFIGRFEPGWDKKTQSLIIKQWWWEPGISVDQPMKNALLDCFQRFMHFRHAVDMHIEPEAVENAELGWLAD